MKPDDVGVLRLHSVLFSDKVKLSIETCFRQRLRFHWIAYQDHTVQGHYVLHPSCFWFQTMIVFHYCKETIEKTTEFWNFSTEWVDYTWICRKKSQKYVTPEWFLLIRFRKISKKKRLFKKDLFSLFKNLFFPSLDWNWPDVNCKARKNWLLFVSCFLNSIHV